MNEENKDDSLPLSVRVATYQRKLLRKGIDGEGVELRNSREILNSLADYKDFHRVYGEKELYEILNKKKLIETPSSLASDDFNYDLKIAFRKHA